MDPNEYRKLETRIQNLKQESQLLQLEIGGVSGPKPRAFETCFFVEARRLLAPDVFQSIFDAAKEKSAT
jgi:hypothetical protein